MNMKFRNIAITSIVGAALVAGWIEFAAPLLGQTPGDSEKKPAAEPDKKPTTDKPDDKPPAETEKKPTETPEAKPAEPKSSLSTQELYRRILPGTTYITAGKFSGSGWLLDAKRRLVITNHHVVDGNLEVHVHFPKMENDTALSERSDYKDDDSNKGEVLLSDPQRDLAVIKLAALPAGAVAFNLAEKSAQPGVPTLSIGNPSSGGALWVLTTGVVRQVTRYKTTLEGGQQFDAKIVRTSSPINRGDSGGPMVDDHGDLIGVASLYRQDAQLMSTFIDVDEVRAFVKEADEIFDPQTPEQFAKQGESYRTRTFLEPALKSYAAGLALDPDSPENLAGRGSCRLQEGKEDEALEDFNHALRIDPANLQARLGRARIGARRGLFEQVIAEMTEIIRREPTAENYRNRALFETARKDFPAALKDVAKAIELEPDNFWHVRELARVHVAAGDIDKAMEVLADLIKKADWPPAYLELGNIHLRQRKDLQAAVKVFSALIKMVPQYAEAYLGRGDALLQAQQFDQAMTDFNTALEHDPRMARAYSLRGDVHLVYGEMEPAIADYLKAVQLEPTDSRMQCDLGVALVRNQDYKNAIKFLMKAEELNPQMTRAVVYLAVAYFSEGDEAEADRALERAAAVDSKLKGAKLKWHEVKNFSMLNTTDQTLEVQAWFYTNAVSGEWEWYPNAPDEGPGEKAELEPGGTLIPGVNGKVMPISKLRFTARSKDGEIIISRYRDVDLPLVTKPGYVDAGLQTFVYPLGVRK